MLSFKWLFFPGTECVHCGHHWDFCRDSCSFPTDVGVKKWNNRFRFLSGHCVSLNHSPDNCYHFAPVFSPFSDFF